MIKQAINQKKKTKQKRKGHNTFFPSRIKMHAKNCSHLIIK